MAFLTGSHAYGVPHLDSDVDLVVYVDSSQLTKLAEALGVAVDDDNRDYPSLNIREGKLNLIVVSESEEYDTWKDVTQDLIKKKPVLRETAVTAFKKALLNNW